MGDSDIRASVDRELREAAFTRDPDPEMIMAFGYNLIIEQILDQMDEVGDAPTTLSQLIWTLQEAKKRAYHVSGRVSGWRENSS